MFSSCYDNFCCCFGKKKKRYDEFDDDDFIDYSRSGRGRGGGNNDYYQSKSGFTINDDGNDKSNSYLESALLQGFGFSAPGNDESNGIGGSIDGKRSQDSMFARENGSNKFEDSYELKNPLGKGSTSTCYVCVHKRSGSQLAAKVIDKRKISFAMNDLMPQFRREVEILKMLNHPHIIKIYDVFESSQSLIVLMELVQGGELFDYLVERPDRLLSEAEASHIIRQVTWAIAYMHQHGVMHRDIKLENILVSRRPNDEEEFPTIKVIDFGLAKRFNPALRKGGIDGQQAAAHTFFGTIGYLAPEMLKRNGYTPAVDNWALGVLTYVLLCGMFPFDDDAQRNPKFRPNDYQLRFPPWKKVSDSAKDVLYKLLEINPSKRLTAAQALRHPWIAGETASRNAVLDTPKLLSVLQFQSSKAGKVRNFGSNGITNFDKEEDNDDEKEENNEEEDDDDSKNYASKLSVDSIKLDSEE